MFGLKDYICNYGDIVQAAGTNCPRCSFVLECIRTGAADVHVPENVNVWVWPDCFCQLNLQSEPISLETFVQNGKLL